MAQRALCFVRVAEHSTHPKPRRVSTHRLASTTSNNDATTVRPPLRRGRRHVLRSCTEYVHALIKKSAPPAIRACVRHIMQHSPQAWLFRIELPRNIYTFPPYTSQKQQQYTTTHVSLSIKLRSAIICTRCHAIVLVFYVPSYYI